MSDFVDYLKDVFHLFGPISSRSMFGGHGIYHNGLMFGLVADDTLYLKVDKQSKSTFEAEGLGPFVYVKKDGKPMNMSYHLAPEEIYDEPEAAARWADIAYQAAVRSQKPTKKKSK
ncbi:MAG: TfoX/Sxy family protein [Chloroflexota bacterium]